jgi:hypothetical protein
MRAAVLIGVAFAAIAVGLPSVAGANGDYDDEAPAYVDAPISPTPGRLLPFPVKDEAAAVAPPLIGAKALPVDPIRLEVPAFSAGFRHDTVLGTSLSEFQSLIIRQSRVEAGKVTLPAASVAYFVEAVPGAVPLGQDALYTGTRPQFLVDFDQSVVVRKGLTIGIGESVVLGSSVIRYANAVPLAGTLSAAFTLESLGGMPWSEFGLGSFEVSISQPAWRARAFREGMTQGRVEDVTDKQVRFAWLSGTRTDAIVLADKLERGDKLKKGDEVGLPGGRKVAVTVVSPGRFVTLDTPDGSKTLAAPPDLSVLPEDSVVRKRLIALGNDWAVVLNPALSDFPAGQAQLFVYSSVRGYRNGELLENNDQWRVWPTALPNGHVIGLFVTNDRPVELSAKSTTLEGPAKVFRLVTEWSSSGELASFVVEDPKGTRSAPVSGSGLHSIDLIAGAGPIARSLLARVKSAEAAAAEGGDAGATPPAPSAPAAASPMFREHPVAYVKPHLYWVLGGAGAGFLLAAIFGVMRRRRKQPWE